MCFWLSTKMRYEELRCWFVQVRFVLRHDAIALHPVESSAVRLCSNLLHSLRLTTHDPGTHRDA
jgi:hypothetical protein